MNTVSTTEARRQLADLLGRARYARERTTITRKGQPFAAIVPLEDLEAMEALENAMDLKVARQRIEKDRLHGGSVTIAEYLDELASEKK